MPIPHVRELEFEYGRVDQITPNIRRVIAHNPSPFTLYGTGTYIVGTNNVAVIDPGPNDAEHIRAICAATEGESISHIVVTHTHMDHSPGCRLLRDFCDAKTYGFGPHGSGHEDDGVVVEEGGDMLFDPDVTVRHNDVIEGDAWSLRCVYTPGHTSNHVCYHYMQENTLFSGDHVMGWSTSVISPPDGDMESYMASLRLLLEEDMQSYWPTHGPVITDPKEYVEALIEHRLDREEQIRTQLRAGNTTISEMVPVMYAATDKVLHPAAARSVFAAISFMVKRGEIEVEGELTQHSRFTLVHS